VSLPQLVNLTLYQDADFSQNFLWANPSPTQPLNPALVTWLSFAGCSAAMQVRQTQLTTSTQYLALSSPSNGIAFSVISPSGYPVAVQVNAFTIAITSAQTLLIPVGPSFYDLFVIYPTGLRVPFLQGQLFMGPTDTR
jgi:hypothetical protein